MMKVLGIAMQYYLYPKSSTSLEVIGYSDTIRLNNVAGNLYTPVGRSGGAQYPYPTGVYKFPALFLLTPDRSIIIDFIW